MIVDTRRSPYARLRPLPIAAVRLADEFWTPRLRTIQRVTLRQQYEQCESTGRIDNFRRAAGRKQVDFQGRYYNDSDVYKWLEAASFALARRPGGEPDAELARLVDEVIGEIAAAQSPDGYLNTYFTFEREPERWTNLVQMHELYCAGHLMQASVAHHRATGQATLLDVATRLADHISRTFGPDARRGTCGHEEIEMALVELYRETGRRVYLDRAGFFLDQRGQRPPVLNGQPYLQDHLPVREQAEIVGHAVRATYLACGLADVFAETGDETLRTAVERLWASAFERKAYVTGGLGAHWAGESFGEDYELPNERAYAETCAAIGGFMWNWRLLLLTGEARCADWMETALYNGILSGLSLDGREYFYQNPLADRGKHRRQPWFGTACCPPNIARLLLSLPGYVASAQGDALWLHHFVAGRVGAGLSGGPLALRVETRYPWDGEIHAVVEQAPAMPCALYLRLPGWCTAPRLTVNGQPAGMSLQAGAYAEVRRAWKPGDDVRLDLPMPVRRLAAHPLVQADARRVALARGPLVYCVEAADHAGVDVWRLEVPDDARFTPEAAPHLLGGVTALRGEAIAAQPAARDGRLYAEQTAADEPARRAVPLTAIPYYAWANRASGPMQVWLHRQP